VRWLVLRHCQVSKRKKHTPLLALEVGTKLAHSVAALTAVAAATTTVAALATAVAALTTARVTTALTAAVAAGSATVEC
jgi:predicted polyphosphate/ATP-dependent NAD kinase